MTEKLKLAHISDIHLDSDYHGGSREYCQNAFAHALKTVRGHSPDLILLAGDLFDTNNASVETIEWAMNALDAQDLPIVMIPGNHDCMGLNGSAATAIYNRFDFNRIPNVTNLTAADGETVLLEALNVAVWGKGMTEHCPEYIPLAGCPERPAGVKWYLGMGHGIHVPHGGQTDRSSPIHMRDLEDSPCDYVALGHHHAALDLMTEKSSAAYCGSPTDDIGVGASYIIAELDDQGNATIVTHTIDG